MTLSLCDSLLIICESAAVCEKRSRGMLTGNLCLDCLQSRRFAIFIIVR